MKTKRATVNSKSVLYLTSTNQLVLNSPSSNKTRPVKSKFKIDSNNSLICRINESGNWREKYSIPGEIKYKGKWRLDDNCNLVLDLQEKEKSGKRKVTLKGEIVNCESDPLIFKIKTKSLGVREVISYLNLKGTWRADKFNRIVFEVKKARQKMLYRRRENAAVLIA